MSEDRLCIDLNVMTVPAADAQFDNYNFNSFCKIGGKCFGANGDGLYELDASDSDAGTDIDATITLPTTDLGTEVVKRLRRGFFGYESAGSMDVTVTFDEDEANQETFQFAPGNTSNQQHGQRFSMTRFDQGRYMTFMIQNVNGCDFSLDSLVIEPVFLGKKPRG